MLPQVIRKYNHKSCPNCRFIVQKIYTVIILPLYRNVDVTGVSLEETLPSHNVSKVVPHESVMFAASVVNHDHCTVQGNPCSVFESGQSALQPDSGSDNDSLGGDCLLLEDSEDDVEFTFRYII